MKNKVGFDQIPDFFKNPVFDDVQMTAVKY